MSMPKPQPPTPSTQKGYAGNKARTNVSIDKTLAEIAKSYFADTRYGSLSGFIDAKMASEFRASAAKLRKAGHKLPESLFAK